jgi:uncharacterized membrane protein HdeD (DUF308 family)
MSDESEQIIADQPSTVETLSHQRILFLMALVVLLGTVAGLIFVSVRFGFGVLIGGALSLVNYYWLKRSLDTVFTRAIAGDTNQFLAGKYILRYFALGAVLTVVYLTEAVPVVAVLLGLASFALAIIFEAIIRILKSFSDKKEI